MTDLANPSNIGPKHGYGEYYLEDLCLFKRLPEPHQRACLDVYEYLDQLRGNPPGLHEFTEHDLRHSLRVLHWMTQILPEEGAGLYPEEARILIVAAMVHDIGMWMKSSDQSSLLKNSEFINYCKQKYPDKLTAVRDCLRSENGSSVSKGKSRIKEPNRREWLGRLGLQQLASWFARDKHANRIQQLLDQLPGLKNKIGDGFVPYVAAVAEAHCWDAIEVRDSDRLEEIQPHRFPLQLRYLAYLLRIGDLLDIGPNRVPTLLWHFFSPMDEVSEAHWRKESMLHFRRCKPDEIKITGHFNIEENGVSEAIAYRFFRDWLDFLAAEVAAARAWRPSTVDPQRKIPLFDALKLTNDVKVTGLPLGEMVGFQFDEPRVIEILGKSIYPYPGVFVRELLQNAIDATRLQIAREHNIDSASVAEEQLQKYAIKVRVSRERRDRKKYLVFEITDRGTGMSLSTIQNHLLKVGETGYTESRLEQAGKFQPIARFGIGFLACLLEADRVLITTRPHDERTGVTLEVQAPSRKFLLMEGKTDTTTNVEAGTTVKLWLKQDQPYEIPDCVWNCLEIATDSGQKKHQQLHIGPKSDKPSALQLNSLVNSILAWCPAVEIPILVNGNRANPYALSSLRIPSSKSKEFNDKNPLTSRAIRVPLRSLSGKNLGNSYLLTRVLTPSSLPWFPKIDDFIFISDTAFLSYLGIHVHGDDDPLFFSEDVTAFHDMIRLPRGSLTASRSLREQRDIFRKINTAITQKVIEHVKQKISVDALQWWSETLPNEMRGWLGYENTIPVNDGFGIKWFPSIEDAAKKYGRLILIPRYLVFQNFKDIPCAYAGTDPEILRQSEQAGSMKLVAVDGCCTGILFPSDANTGDLKPPAAKATYTPVGLMLLDSNEEWPTLSRGIRIEKHQNYHKFEEWLSTYDRERDPWDSRDEVILNIPRFLCEIDEINYNNIEAAVIPNSDDWE